MVFLVFLCPKGLVLYIEDILQVVYRLLIDFVSTPQAAIKMYETNLNYI